MAHGIQKILIKQEKIECNNNLQCEDSKMALSNLLLNSSCCPSTTNQNLLNQKNSSTTTNASIHQTLPPTHSATTLMNNSNGNKLTLNHCSGASMSTITSSSTAAAKSPTTGTKMGSRRIFTPQFKLQVLESYRNDSDCKGNQRATARKYGIHRRQIQKWLQCENNLRSIAANNPQNVRNNAIKSIPKATAPILSSSSTSSSRHRGVVGANTEKSSGTATYSCFTLANMKNYKANVNNVVGSSSTTKSLISPSSSSSSFVTFENFASNASANLSSTPFPSNHFYFDNCHMLFNKFEELPIDLSCSNSSGMTNGVKIKTETVARPIPLHPSTLSNYKIPFYNYSPAASSSTSPQLIDISNSVIKSEVDPIDLSISNVSHKRKHSTDNDNNKKPIKLFRPYLESNFDKAELVKDDKHQVLQGSFMKEEDEEQKFPIIWSNAYNYYPDHFQPPVANHPFLLNTSISPYESALSSPNDSGIMNTSFNQPLTRLPPSQASPVSGYDSSTSSIYSFNDNEVDLSQGNSPPYTSSHYDAPSPPLSSATLSPTSTETKVPLSSSSFLHDLKFKLHTLDCYYNDADCKRNEKLVANKLNINCKVVEKWLRQESDLRDQQKQYHLQILA